LSTARRYQEGRRRRLPFFHCCYQLPPPPPPPPPPDEPPEKPEPLEWELASVLPTELENVCRLLAKSAGANGWTPVYQLRVEASAVSPSPSKALAHLFTQPKTMANGRERGKMFLSLFKRRARLSRAHM